jgi:DNA-binding NtrC family response regulator
MKSESGPSRCGILVVDDDAGLVETLRDFLARDGYSVEIALSAQEALAAQQRTPSICLALVDLMMPLVDGLTLMEKLRERDSDLTVIIMTGFGSIETAVEAMKRGAEDYITKPFDADSIRKKVGRVMEIFQLRGRVAELESSLRDRCRSFESLIYVSPLMQEVVERAQAAAQTDASVLILGETGTGKEKLARAIHGASRRATGPFLPVNCGALPRELVESELFGYRRGAFTGAYTDKPGIFASARGGTVFLDEIGEMPKEAQVKLLRVLQEKELRPVGGTKPLAIDVRMVAATNRHLDELRAESLREDLYYRIATVILEIPALRSRSEDVLVLAQHFTRQLSERSDREINLTRSALEQVLKYSFPGNVRELENMLESVTAISQDDPQNITDRDIKSQLKFTASAGATAPVIESSVALDQLEKMAIERALQLAGGNRTKAAGLLGISRDTLYRKLRELKAR